METGRGIINLIAKFTSSVLEASGVFSFAIIFGCVLYTVAARQLALNALFWMDNFVDLLMIWIVFMGAALCQRDNSHISSSFLLEALRRRNAFLAKLLLLLEYLLVLFFLVVLGGGAWKFMAITGQSLLSSIPIAKAWWIIPILVSSVLMFLYTLSHISSIMKTKQAQEPYSESI